MQSLVTIVSILIPLFLGFFVRLSPNRIQKINHIVNVLIYAILLLIGLSLATVDNLAAQLGTILVSVVVLFTLLMVFNIVALAWFDKSKPWKNISGHQNSGTKPLSLLNSAKQISSVVVGFLIGLIFPSIFQYFSPGIISNYAILLLIFLVGIQLRSSGITLRQVLLNKRGVYISGYFIVSSLLAGVLFSLLFTDVSLSKGLALASGFGWYSLSSIVIHDAYGPVWGGIALVNDLAREIFAFIFIPVIMRFYPSAAVGVGGATSLDFTLPVIQASGGVAIVPLAISFGFVVNVVSPILMVFFSSLSF